MFKRENFHEASYLRLVKVSEQGIEFELSSCQRVDEFALEAPWP